MASRSLLGAKSRHRAAIRSVELIVHPDAHDVVGGTLFNGTDSSRLHEIHRTVQFATKLPSRVQKEGREEGMWWHRRSAARHWSSRDRCATTRGPDRPIPCQHPFGAKACNPTCLGRAGGR